MPLAGARGALARGRLRAEELGEKVVAAAADVGSHVIDDAGQSTDAEDGVVGDRDVVLAAGRRRETDMAPCLPRHTVTETSEGPGELSPREVSREPHTAISCSRT